ncbi:hypothetical protein EST38_g8743, partial [Candolleomyces aberdarensis]
AVENCRPFFDELLNRQIHNAAAPTDLLGSVDHPSKANEGGEEVSASWGSRVLKLPLNALSPLQAHLGTSKAPSVGVSSSQISIRGLSYSVASRHAGDSQCMVRAGGLRHGPTPAIIHHIFQVDHRGEIETFLLIERLATASVQRNPFNRYIWPEMGLYEQKGELEVIEPSAVLSHFAQLPVEWEGQNTLCWQRRVVLTRHHRHLSKANSSRLSFSPGDVYEEFGPFAKLSSAPLTMTRVLLTPAPNFDLPDTLRQAMALDCEELDEDARGSKRDSEGRAVVTPVAPTGPPEPSRLMRAARLLMQFAPPPSSTDASLIFA